MDILKPDICRCCLSASGTWDLTAAYLTDTGLEEVFSDLLLKCFGITLSHLMDRGASHFVCELCVTHMRDTNIFHKQVLRADKDFNSYWESRTESLCSPIPTDDISSDLFQNEHKQVRKRRRTIQKKEKDDYDSDTPIAQIKNEFLTEHLDSDENFELLDNRPHHLYNKVKIQDTGQFILKNKTDHKHVSERKRIIITCGIVLGETTACPFRHHKSWFQCFFCSQDFMEMNLLRNHTLQAHADVEAELKKIKRYPRSLQIDISSLECRHCQLNLTDVSTMKRHFVEIHNKLIYNECIADYKIDSSPYSCHICKQEFHVFRTLTTHLNEHYANCICDVCGKSFINSKRLKVHARTHENGNYPCTECGKILKTKTSKANHMESAHSKRIIKCQICFKPMKHYNDRIKHMSEVHNITHKFQCFICSRVYNIKHYLATHIRQTHGHKNKKCLECSMTFITNYSLKKHMLKHTGERPFKCNMCTKSYARSYTLKEHMRSHGNEKL